MLVAAESVLDLAPLDALSYGHLAIGFLRMQWTVQVGVAGVVVAMRKAGVHLPGPLCRAMSGCLCGFLGCGLGPSVYRWLLAVVLLAPAFGRGRGSEPEQSNATDSDADDFYRPGIKGKVCQEPFAILQHVMTDFDSEDEECQELAETLEELSQVMDKIIRCAPPLQDKQGTAVIVPPPCETPRKGEKRKAEDTSMASSSSAAPVQLSMQPASSGSGAPRFDSNRKPICMDANCVYSRQPGMQPCHVDAAGGYCVWCDPVRMREAPKDSLVGDSINSRPPKLFSPRPL